MSKHYGCIRAKKSATSEKFDDRRHRRDARMVLPVHVAVQPAGVQHAVRPVDAPVVPQARDHKVAGDRPGVRERRDELGHPKLPVAWMGERRWTTDSRQAGNSSTMTIQLENLPARWLGLPAISAHSSFVRVGHSSLPPTDSFAPLHTSRTHSLIHSLT